jgi:hypothetical protein
MFLTLKYMFSGYSVIVPTSLLRIIFDRLVKGTIGALRILKVP